MRSMRRCSPSPRTVRGRRTWSGSSLDDRVEQPGFRLVLGRLPRGGVAGFAFGHGLTPATPFWHGLLDDLPAAFTSEPTGRTFAIFELAVLAPHRRQGWGRALHDGLLRDRPEQRVALLSRPEAPAAQAAYRSWGYRRVAGIRPRSGGPRYDALVRASSLLPMSRTGGRSAHQ